MIYSITSSEKFWTKLMPLNKPCAPPIVDHYNSNKNTLSPVEIANNQALIPDSLYA